MATPLELVQGQFDAYNQHDIDKFANYFSENFVAYRMPLQKPSLEGRDQLIKFYTEQRFNVPELRAKLITRQVMGNKVFDYEIIHGMSEVPIETFAIFEIKDNLICTAWFYNKD